MASPARDEAADSLRPTHRRYLVVTVTVVMSLLLYFDRFCMNIMEPYLKQDLGITNRQISLLWFAFFFAYALGQVPAGWLSDRFGARLMLTAYIVSWSLFTAFTGLANAFLAVLVMRVGFGVAQAGAYPTSAGLLGKWVPFSSRGVASGLVSMGGRVGLFCAPVVTAYLIVAFVPQSSSSLLTPDQIRVEVRALDAPPPKKSGAWNRVDGFVGPENSRLLDSAFLEGEPPSEAQREQITHALNGVISNPAFSSEAVQEFDSLKIEREALWLLQQEQQGHELDSAASQRLNRLLLEAIFPNNLGKVYVRGWRPVMLIYGVAGLLVGAWFWLVFRDRPEIHPRCNAAEQALIAAGKPANAPSTEGKAGAIPWGRLLRSRSLWLDSIAQIGTNIGWVFLATSLPRYLAEQHHVEMITRSWMTAIPTLGGILGMWWGGTLTDWMTSRFGLRWGRGLPIAITRFLAGGCYVVALFVTDPWVATGLFVGVALFCDLGIPAMWAFKQDVGGRYTGCVLGWGNMWGNLAAAVSSPLYDLVLGSKTILIGGPNISETGTNWEAMFVMCAGAMILSGFAGLGIDASIPIAPPDEDEPSA